MTILSLVFAIASLVIVIVNLISAYRTSRELDRLEMLYKWSITQAMMTPEMRAINERFHIDRDRAEQEYLKRGRLN